jgi:transcriptional regulator with PAS, ATPase and Fis domain
LLVISQRALDSYNYIIQEINHFLGEEDWKDNFVIDPQHIEELKELRREAALNQQLEDLLTERQRYLDAIQESESLISKLKEKNAAPSIIAEEQALIDKNKSCIEELDLQISVLRDTPSTNK